MIGGVTLNDTTYALSRPRARAFLILSYSARSVLLVPELTNTHTVVQMSILKTISHKYSKLLSREMRSRTQMQRYQVSLITKLNKRTTKTTPKGKNKQAGRQAEDWSTVKHLTHMRHTKDNGSAQDCRHKENYIGRQTRATRETQLEPLKQ